MLKGVNYYGPGEGYKQNYNEPETEYIDSNEIDEEYYEPRQRRPLIAQRTLQPGRKKKLSEVLAELVAKEESMEKRAETKATKKPWKIPFSWGSKAKEASKKRDSILVFYLNIKGEIEQPMVVPIYGGSMVIIRNKIHEIDPRAVWTLKTGGLFGGQNFKCMIFKEIDRRPVSNLDLDEIKRKGDSTDSDEFLIKAALKAQTVQTAKPMNKWILWVGGLIIVGVILYFLFK